VIPADLPWPRLAIAPARDAGVSEPDARFERVVKEHGAALSRLAFAYAADAADRDDLLQDILFALWRALPAFRGECTERAYVFRVAHNRALTHRRRRRRAVPPQAATVLGDPPPDPASRAAAAERHARLMAAVRRLPASQRQVVMLYLEGLTNLEIADVLGVTANNVGVRLARAREMLRAWLGPEQAEGSA
jgi:RNA polymerase sigma-70 factor (ECF subfamily)